MAKGKRARTKYPALKPELNLKTRYELIDYDYINKLSEEDKKWLNKFTEEYVNASLNAENLTENFHNTKELKKDCYRRNNARNRDILTRAKASGNYISTDELMMNLSTAGLNLEQELLEQIDNVIGNLEESCSRTNNNRDDSNNF